MKSSEKEIENVFKKYTDDYIKKIGHRNATTNHELNNLGNLTINDFLGVFSQDSKIPKTPRKASFIINTDFENEQGSHWMGVHRSRNDTYYIFDSFGRESRKLIPHFVRGKFHIDSDYDKNQHKSTNICGPLCLAWLRVVQEHGIRKALLI